MTHASLLCRPWYPMSAVCRVCLHKHSRVIFVLWAKGVERMGGPRAATYTKQLKDYEEKVMQKRFEEMSEEERAALAEAPVPKPEDPKSVRRWI